MPALSPFPSYMTAREIARLFGRLAIFQAFPDRSVAATIFDRYGVVVARYASADKVTFNLISRDYP